MYSIKVAKEKVRERARMGYDNISCLKDKDSSKMIGNIICEKQKEFEESIRSLYDHCENFI